MRDLGWAAASVCLATAVACSDDDGTDDTASAGAGGATTGSGGRGGDASDGGGAAGEATGGSGTGGSSVPFGGPADVERAGHLWSDIDGYESWPPFDGMDGFVESAAPHGAYVRFFLNNAASGDPAGMPNGSIVIKENFTDMDESTLAAITVMVREDGSSPDSGDWFFAKYLPDGSLDENPNGVPLAGAVGVGSDAGCVPCHSTAPGDDFVFLN